MKNLNCDFFQMTINFDEKQFKKKEFVLDIKPKKKNITSFNYTYGSKNKKRKEHAHLSLSLEGKNSILRVSFAQGESESEDIREPYLENFTKWIAGFFIEKELPISIMAIFKYNQKYESLVQLNYPLLVGSGLYKGALITGHEIHFPDEIPMNKAIITIDKKSIFIILNSILKTDFSEFDFLPTAEMFGKFAEALVNVKEENSGKSSERTKA